MPRYGGSAFSIKIDVDNVIPRELSRASLEIMQDLRKVVAKSALKVTGEAKKKIANPPKTGRVYKRRWKDHQASAPGEAPAGDSGDLANSIRTNLSLDGLGAAIGSELDYADILELGSTGGKIEARPFLSPSLMELEDQINNDITDVLKRHLK